MNENTPLLQKNYDFLLYLIPILQKLPRNQKFLLADRIQNKVMDNQEKILQALYAPKPEKLMVLNEINLSLEQLRFLFRLCHDLKLIDTHRYEYVSRQTNEIGAMVGGWRKIL
jgi:hypothetical protein